MTIVCRRKAALLTLSLMIWACGSSGSGGPGGSGGAGGVGAFGGFGGSAVCGAKCQCADGREGVTECGSGAPTCSCTSCPEFTPGNVEFQPCGGEPFGTWRAVSSDAAGVALDVYASTSQGIQLAGSCPLEIVTETQPTDMRLMLESGGSAVVAVTGPDWEFKLLDSCIKSKTPSHCTDLQGVAGGKLACTPGACGICSCQIAPAPSHETGTWSRSGTELTLALGSNVISLPYCVQGETMTVQRPSGEIVTLRLAATLGSPTPCGFRTAAECARGTGCQQGACVGATNCENASTEKDCTNVAGCGWDLNKCGGAAPSTCSLADYGVVPGCTFADGKWACAGAPPPCEERTNTDCSPQSGCQNSPRYVGGALSCGAFGCNGCLSARPPSAVRLLAHHRTAPAIRDATCRR